MPTVPISPPWPPSGLDWGMITSAVRRALSGIQPGAESPYEAVPATQTGALSPLPADPLVVTADPQTPAAVADGRMLPVVALITAIAALVLVLRLTRLVKTRLLPALAAARPAQLPAPIPVDARGPLPGPSLGGEVIHDDPAILRCTRRDR